ncbi:MAG TPA: hypothetical protein VFA44_10190 [Gaiellaceae bacterium]|nr:hypothetical protein [Gaiellaceae bacterium]
MSDGIFLLRGDELLAPQALDLLAVRHPALAAQASPGLAVAPARMGAGELAQASAKGVVAICLPQSMALGRAVLPCDPARPPLERSRDDPRASLRPRVCATSIPTFPFAISRSARFSSSWSATIRFSLTFLALELLQALGVLRLQAAVLGAPAVQRLLGDLELLGDQCDLPAFPEQPLGLPELPDHPLRRVPAPSPLSHRFDCPPCP